MRVRGFVQDDGHIFCTEEQILGECVAYTALLQKVYRDFGFTDIIYKVANAAGQAHRLGRVGRGEGAQGIARSRRSGAFCSAGRRCVLRAEDRVLAEGRHRPVWQCGTMQVDFSMPACSAPNTSPRTTRGARR